MWTKMKMFCPILSVFCVVSFTNSEEIHSIDRRILENQENPYTKEYQSNHTDLHLLPPLEKVAASINVSALVQIASCAIDTAANSSISSGDQGISRGNLNVTSVEASPIKVNTSAVDQAHHNRNGVNVTALLRTNTSETHSTVLAQPSPTYRKTEVSGNKTEEPIGTEVKDLLNEDSKQKQDVFLENHQHPFEPQEPIHIPDKIDKETELIENGENTEDILRRHKDEEKIDPPRGPVAIILVSSLVILSVLCYAGLLLWRRYLEDRYGSRTLLVNAEELADPNDLRNFTI